MIDEHDIIAILRSAANCESFYLELRTADATMIVRAGAAAETIPPDQTGPRHEPHDAARPTEVPVAAPVSGAPAPGNVEHDEPAVAEDDFVEGDIIRATVSGTFYRSPAPGAAPFCEPGDEIQIGGSIGLIEVMKLFNQVMSERSGVFDRYLAQDGAPVQMGDPLVKFRA